MSRTSKEVLDAAIDLVERQFGDQAKAHVVCIHGHRSDATIASIRDRSVKCPRCSSVVRAYAIDKHQDDE